jgi:hypothetical protein
MNTEEAHELAMFAVWWLVKFGLIKVCAVQIIEPAILKISLESFVHDFGKILSLGLKKCFYTTGDVHHGSCMPALSSNRLHIHCPIRLILLFSLAQSNFAAFFISLEIAWVQGKRMHMPKPKKSHRLTTYCISFS